MTKDNNILSARERILARVRANRPEAVTHPEVPVFPIAGEPVENFINHVEGFDGKVVNTNSREKALAWLRDNISQSDSYPVYSGVEGYEGNITLDQLPSPADAHKLSASVGEGILGIGETGSVLVEPKSNATRPTCGRGPEAPFSTTTTILPIGATTATIPIRAV